MRKLMTILILIFASANVACATHGYDRYGYRGYGYDGLARAAHQLEYAAEHFYRQLRHDIGRDHATRDAAKFAEAARHFHRQVERGGSYRHLRNDYAELARAYAHAYDEFGGRHDLHHDRHFRGDFGAVERAFADLNRAIGYGDGHYSRYRDH